MLQYQHLPVTSFQQNCSLLWCDQTKQAVFVDPGGEADQLITLAEKYSLEVTGIWLTHGHLDHIGAAAELRLHYQVPVTGPHEDDKFLFDAIPVQCEMFGFGLIDSFYPDEWLKHGDSLMLGNESFHVIHTPGHTPGHIVFQHAEQKLLWVGDVIFYRSIGRTDFPRGNHADLLSSIKQRVLPLGDEYRFIPGHGPESTLGDERSHNPFLL